MLKSSFAGLVGLVPVALSVQVPIENQVKTIVWFTIVGNAFFVIRATIEIILAASFTILWKGASCGTHTLCDGGIL